MQKNLFKNETRTWCAGVGFCPTRRTGGQMVTCGRRNQTKM